MLMLKISLELHISDNNLLNDYETAEKIKNTQNNVNKINTLIGCEYLPTVKGKYYNTSGALVATQSGKNTGKIPIGEYDTLEFAGKISSGGSVVIYVLLSS